MSAWIFLDERVSFKMFIWEYVLILILELCNAASNVELNSFLFWKTLGKTMNDEVFLNTCLLF